MKNILVLSDHSELLEEFRKLVKSKQLRDWKFNYAYTVGNENMKKKYPNEDWIVPLNVKSDLSFILNNYEVVISLHCKQFFPKELVSKVRCINIHPGLNPNNRGYFPHIFSIINGMPCGATIHEMDERLDHGPIIAQKEVNLEIWDTSLTAYQKITAAEMELVEQYLTSLITGNYSTSNPEGGNINKEADFKKLCVIDLNEKDSFLNHINHLRALTHGEYKNAYFYDEKGNKIFLKLELVKE